MPYCAFSHSMYLHFLCYRFMYAKTKISKNTVLCCDYFRFCRYHVAYVAFTNCFIYQISIFNYVF